MNDESKDGTVVFLIFFVLLFLVRLKGLRR